MDRKTWCTKEDVLKDLELASGQKVTDVDDNCFIVGERPPPPRLYNDEDDEIELLFGRAASRQQINGKEETGPDLPGITKMLRMIHEYEKSSDEEGPTSTAAMNKGNVIVISKLNPNVNEFIPKTISSQNCTITDKVKTVRNKIDKPIDSNINVLEKASAIVETETDAVKTKNDSNINVLEKASAIVETETDAVKAKNEENPKEINKQMATMLKNKITTKSNTFEEKRQANFAIVNLLKLYAKPEPKAAKPIKLFTPDFFENCKASEFNTDTEDTNTYDCSFEQMTSLPSVDEVNKTDLPLKQPRHFDNSSTKNDETNIVSTLLRNKNEEFDEIKGTSLTPDMADNRIGDYFSIPSQEVKPDPDVEESIAKVNNWLDNKPYVKKEKPKSPALYLGAVCYKRKDPVTCKSPSEVADKKILKPSEASYQPSSYADELHKKYKENSKEKTTTRPLNIWEKLEEDLKKKDMEIRNRKKKA